VAHFATGLTEVHATFRHDAALATAVALATQLTARTKSALRCAPRCVLSDLPLHLRHSELTQIFFELRRSGLKIAAPSEISFKFLVRFTNVLTYLFTYLITTLTHSSNRFHLRVSASKSQLGQGNASECNCRSATRNAAYVEMTL